MASARKMQYIRKITGTVQLPGLTLIVLRVVGVGEGLLVGVHGAVHLG